MTKRQKALGVTEFGYEVGIKEGEFLLNSEAFLAKMATIKKGRIHRIGTYKNVAWK